MSSPANSSETSGASRAAAARGSPEIGGRGSLVTSSDCRTSRVSSSTGSTRKRTAKIARWENETIRSETTLTSRPEGERQWAVRVRIPVRKSSARWCSSSSP